MMGPGSRGKPSSFLNFVSLLGPLLSQLFGACRSAESRIGIEQATRRSWEVYLDDHHQRRHWHCFF